MWLETTLEKAREFFLETREAMQQFGSEDSQSFLGKCAAHNMTVSIFSQ